MPQGYIYKLAQKNIKFMTEVKEQVALAPLNLTEGAIKALKRIMNDQSIPTDHALRVGVKGGGCSGLMYQLEFDNEMHKDDKEFEDNGIKVVVDKKSFLYLVGTELDYQGGLNGKGFVFHNPNAGRTCGCGGRCTAVQCKVFF